jgi:hypothetical protein
MASRSSGANVFKQAEKNPTKPEKEREEVKRVNTELDVDDEYSLIRAGFVDPKISVNSMVKSYSVEKEISETDTIKLFRAFAMQLAIFGFKRDELEKVQIMSSNKGMIKLPEKLLGELKTRREQGAPPEQLTIKRFCAYFAEDVLKRMRKGLIMGFIAKKFDIPITLQQYAFIASEYSVESKEQALEICAYAKILQDERVAKEIPNSDVINVYDKCIRFVKNKGFDVSTNEVFRFLAVNFKYSE